MTTNTVLFLCTGNYYRSRFAEVLFNATAVREGLPWRADSRGLALERGFDNVGPISVLTLQALRTLEIEAGRDLRFPLPLTERDLERADLVVAVKAAEHRPLMEQRFPAWTERVEYWHVHDLDCAGPEEALLELEREVRGLSLRLGRRPAAGITRSENVEPHEGLAEF